MVSYVVTGASRGLGLQFVKTLAANANNQVFALVRNIEGSTELKQLAESGRNVYIVSGDLDKPETLKPAAEEVAKITGGSLDVLINNAAKTPGKNRGLSLSDYIGKEDVLIEEFNEFTNVIGAALVVNAFLPLLEKGPTKKVVTISSFVGDVDFVVKSGLPISASYSASKSAVNMVNAKYAAEFREKEFVFLAVSPGFVGTWDHKSKGLPSEFAKRIDAIAQVFKKVARPDWEAQPSTPEKSVELVLGVIDRATPADSGKFVSQFGNQVWL